MLQRTLRAALVTVLLLLGALPLLGANGAPSTPTRPPAPAAPESAAAHPLIEMLTFVPNTPEYRDMLTWGDAAAWYAATGITPVEAIDEAVALSEEERQQVLYALFNQTVPPEALGIQYLRSEDMRGRYGFSFFDARQMLGAGQPPDSLAVVTVDADPPAIDTALSSTGYTMTQASGAALYSLRGDYELDVSSESLVGRMGTLNRIALVEAAASPTLVIGRADAPVEAALAAHAGEVPSLADDPLFRFAAEYLTDGTFGYLGKLVGLIFLEPQPGDPMAALGMEGDEIQAQVERYQKEPMPPPLLNAFATFRDGSDTVLMLFVVLPTYYPADQTEETAALLYDRLGSYISLRTKATLDDMWTPEAYGTVRADPISAAYVTMRLTDDADNLFAWTKLIFARDLLFLTPGTNP